MLHFITSDPFNVQCLLPIYFFSGCREFYTSNLHLLQNIHQLSTLPYQWKSSCNTVNFLKTTQKKWKNNTSCWEKKAKKFLYLKKLILHNCPRIKGKIDMLTYCHVSKAWVIFFSYDFIANLLVDETRVKLLIDEDDDLGSDYINASYIKVSTLIFAELPSSALFLKSPIFWP